MPSIPVLATVAVAGVIAASTAVPVVAGMAPTPASPPGSTGPLLTIAVDNGRTAVVAGDQLTYTITVRNLGSTATIRLDISQSLPAGLTFLSADRGGTAQGGSVHWLVDLGAGQQDTLTTAARVEQTPAELLRLATVACATARGGHQPLVCATHADLLPAGAAATRADPPARNRSWYGVAGAGLVVLVLAATVLAQRWWRRRAPTAATR